MAPILNCQSLTKSYSSRPLFRGISFSLDEADRVGLIGPNGAGKSTLLKIMAAVVAPDGGTIVAQKGLRPAYVPQDEQFDSKLTVRAALLASVGDDVEEHERETRVNIIGTQVGFADMDESCGVLSGGWRKRLSIASRLVQQPDLLLLDEPTNHLDMDGVLWLESLLLNGGIPFVLVTHDRTFLQNTTNRIIELNGAYADGYISVVGNYSKFLLAREQYMVAQSHLEQAIASKVRREVAWLQRGARARQTKAQARIDEAARLIDELAEVKLRNARNASVEIDFNASGRQTKELLVVKHAAKRFGDKRLFSDVSMILSPGTRVGVLGSNGSGKTTLLKLLAGQIASDQGTIKRADGLKVIEFDQNRQQLNQQQTLREALCPSGDSVVYQGRSLHVASWSKKFLFRPDQLNMPISYLSGGEQARILLANLMLQPADVLILDEPTNDLDIPSLEVLEDSLLEFTGALVLVTHDRYMLDTVSTVILALDGSGGASFFADWAQWDANRSRAQPSQPPSRDKRTASGDSSDGGVKAKQQKLSTNEKRELENIDQTIETAERHVEELEQKLANPAIASNHVQLQAIMHEVDAAKQHVARLYARWDYLQERSKA
jgi:ABC transport system ATP-binding/permease protein